MSSECSTLSTHSVVLSWLKDHADCPFPMKEFTKAISHDLQGSHVLLQHVGHIRPFWQHGLPSTHRKRHQLYVGDLRPRLSKDLKRVERLIAFVEGEVQVFCSNRASRFSHRDNSVAAALLKQLQIALQHLLYQIDSLPDDKPALPDLQADMDSRKEGIDERCRNQHQRSKIPVPARRNPSSRNPNTSEKPKKKVRFQGHQAQTISLIKPEQAPAIVTQLRPARCNCDRTQSCQCPEKLPSPTSPILRVDSAMSIR